MYVLLVVLYGVVCLPNTALPAHQKTKSKLSLMKLRPVVLPQLVGRTAKHSRQALQDHRNELQLSETPGIWSTFTTLRTTFSLIHREVHCIWESFVLVH